MKTLSAIATVLLVGATAAVAGPEKVAFPEGYATSFVRYATVDRPDRDPPIVRFFYVNRTALAEAAAGEPLPHGTVIVMEDHLAELDDDGAPVTQPDGAFIPMAGITNIFVQEKGEGWGAEYPDETRNGEWEYNWFLADGSLRPEAKFDGCFACHKDNAGEQDFNFTLSPFVDEIKG